jgi:hypothetical protein
VAAKRASAAWQAGLRPIKLQPDEWAAIYHVNKAADATRLLLAVPPPSRCPPT